MIDNYNTTANSETSPLSYNPHDILEFMEIVDPYNTGFKPLIKSLSQASSSVPVAKKYVLGFMRHTLSLNHQDPFKWDDEFEEWWSDTKEAVDLRDIAKHQAEDYKKCIFELKLSHNHPEKIRDITESYQEIVDDLETWAAKPRKDFLAQCEEELVWENWPKKLTYETKNASKNAKLFREQHPSQFISSGSQLYMFKNGIWNERSDKELEAEIRKTDPTSALDVDQVTKMVKGIHQWTAINEKPYEWLENTMNNPQKEDLCLFNNGIYNLRTGELLPLDGSYFATGLPDHDYNPFAECPTFMKWLDETLDPSFHITLQQYFGYCLTPNIQAHKFMTFVGTTRSGKSTANNILKDLVGNQHVASAMMPDLGSEFGMMKFLDKRLIIVPDAHDAPTKNRAAALERIKSITGGDDVAVNRKHLSPTCNIT